LHESFSAGPLTGIGKAAADCLPHRQVDGGFFAFRRRRMDFGSRLDPVDAEDTASNAPSARPHLVVIGNGMAGCRAVEELLARDPDRYRITIFGAEPRVN
jgi:nitrite reductase (NADH) large subunit